MDSQDPSSGKPLSWTPAPDLPPDFGGPIDVPYEPISGSTDRIMGLEDVERAADRFPDKIAIDDGVLKLTYRQVLDRAYALAGRLAERLGPGARVVSLVYNSAAAPVIILASAAAGLTLVPIDAGHPLERAKAIFAESGAHALIVAEGETINDGFVPDHLPRFRVDCREESRAPRFRSRPRPAHAPIFVIFTSGSTGRPKGVAHDRTDGIRRTVDAFHVNSSDVVLGLASLSTGGAGQAFVALTTGATIRIVDVMRSGIAEVLRVMHDDRVTILSFVPTVLRTLMAAPGIERSFAHLRILDMHGETTLQSDIALFRSKLPSACHISITFSATETGPMFQWFVDERRFQGGVVPVGYIAPGKEIAIVGEGGEPAVEGEVGELSVRGAMAAGSWQKGRLTPARFIDDPNDPSRKIYHTGDLVRRRADGLVEFVGRLDRQIKIRGLWADLAEIETAIRGYPSIKDAAVTVHASQGRPDLLAAFVATDDENLDVADLRRHVGEATADHMIPTRIERVERIPRLANHKPDLLRLDAILRSEGPSAARAAVED